MRGNLSFPWQAAQICDDRTMEDPPRSIKVTSETVDHDGSTPDNPGRSTGRRLHGAIAHRLGSAILSGEYQPGDTLSSEVAFSEALQVSRSAYREAMQALAAKGLLESRPKTGTRVLPRTRWNLLDPDVLAWAFAGEPDPQFVSSLFGLRGIVEPAAARLAAERRDRHGYRTLARCTFRYKAQRRCSGGTAAECATTELLGAKEAE